MRTQVNPPALVGAGDAANKKKPNAKHVSRACLQCRQRHLKCDGHEPRCNRCEQNDKDCSYVKSNRGGSRKKGVKKIKTNPPSESDPINEYALPCVGTQGEQKPCPNGHDNSTCGFLRNKDMNGVPCHDLDQHTRDSIKLEAAQRLKPKTKFLKQDFNTRSIINNYYECFHKTHPVLPPSSEIDQFLVLTGNPKEILAIMKVIGDGYTTSKYAKNISDIFDIAGEIIEHMKSKPKDVISLQALILLSLTCHISALYDLSASLRREAIQLVLSLDINNLDIDTYAGDDINGNENKRETNSLTPTSADEVNVNFYNSKRVRALPDRDLKEAARRCFWELFFLDIIIGSSDGKTLSKLTSIECFVNFPSTPSKITFDYETRSYTSKLVDDSVRLNNIIFSDTTIGHQYTKLTASLSNWELKFSNPDFYKLPYLIDGNGTVNEGIQQGLIMLNYAKIFTHRPLSFLWRSDIPRNLKCVEKLNNELNKSEKFQEVPNGKDLINSRKIIETRKTIDAANLIAKTLIDTNPIDILKRTPLNACSLAFAGLVHLSAFLWSSQLVQNTKESNPLNSNDLNIYEEYMKLELSSIYQISSHWYLSSKIANYLMESISKLTPKLHRRISSHFKPFTQENGDKKALSPRTALLTRKTLDKTATSTSEAISNDLRKVFEAPAGFLDSGLSYNLPDLIPTSQSPTQFEPSVIPAETQKTPMSASSSICGPVSSQEPVSPFSDTGCNWIDKNQLDFNFTNYNFGEFDLDSLNAIDEMIKGASIGNVY